jgi:starch synthase (maltosyl-transferring)
VHGTFATAAAALPRIAQMGFDVVYLPPIHPIGKVHRKGRNNYATAAPGDVGSPWAIGSDEGGHDAVHPRLGTIADFDKFVAAVRGLGMEVALDLALQCAPDHPWARKHREWFTELPDGTIAYAENPPKKYQDIYPINFDNDPAGLYDEVLRVVRYWMDHGVKVFRVDNPHTKPPNFWAWLIAQVKAVDPDVLFLSEAFTPPARQYGLAKLGFTQSYTYFTWRTAKWELTEFGQQISEIADYRRPNLFVNTPDILHAVLQHNGPGMFAIRAVLAATMSPTWGVYSGYELFEGRAVAEGSEEYLNSEKYELRPRDFAGALAAGRSLEPFIAQLNNIRRLHPALQQLRNIHLPRHRQRRIAGLQQVRPDHRRLRTGRGDAQRLRAGGGDAVVGHGRIGYGAIRAVLGARRNNRRGIPVGSGQLRAHRSRPRCRPHHQHAARTVPIANYAAAQEVTPR